MPEDPIGNAADAAEHAVDALGEGRPDKWAKVTRLAALSTAVTALLASLGAFFKSFDHSATEGTYKTTTELILKLDERQQKTEADIASLRGYLDGLAHAPIIPSPTPPPTGGGGSGGAPNVVPSATVRTWRPWPPASATASTPSPDAGLVTFAIQAPPLPPARPPAAPVKPPPFDVAAGAK